MPVKVAYIVEYPIPYDALLFEKIAKRPEVDLTILFLSDTIAERGWKIDPTGRFPFKIIKGKRWFVSSNTQFTAFWNPGIFTELESGGYEVVGTSGYIPFTHYAVLKWLKRKKIPHFLRSEATLPSKRSTIKRFVKSLLLTPVVKSADAWLASGTLAKKYLIHYGADPERVFYLNYTIDDESFAKSASEARLNRERIKGDLGIDARYVILFSGRLATMKGIHTLFDAFKITKGNRRDVALAFLGSGPLQPEIEARMKAEGIKDVHFLGFHQAVELPAFYGISDLLVLPSTYEPWGIVVNEALAASLPVVASDVVGAAADLVLPGQTGFRFKTGDAKELADCIERLLASEKLREEMGRAGRELVKEWGLDRSVSGFVSAALTAVSKKKV